MPLAEIDGDVIAVYADWRDKELITQVPGSRYDKDRDAWTLPIAWGPCVQLRSLFGDALQVGPFLARWSRSERSLAVDPCLALRTAQDADMGESTFADRLYPFQRAGVKFMATAGRALNADEMSLCAVAERSSAICLNSARIASTSAVLLILDSFRGCDRRSRTQVLRSRVRSTDPRQPFQNPH